MGPPSAAGPRKPQQLKGSPVHATPLATMKPAPEQKEDKPALVKQDSKSFMGLFKSKSDSSTKPEPPRPSPSVPQLPSQSAVAAEVLSRSRSQSTMTMQKGSNAPKERISNSASTTSESPVNNAPIANASDDSILSKRRSFSAS
jgi:hypothetical protein